MSSAIIVGAGVFGASLAHRLAGAGWDVTLVDPRAPGHPHASSGGESRLIRCAHGADAWHARSACRARELWRELEREAGEELLVEAGVAWFAHRDDGWDGDSERTLRAEQIPVERLDPGEAARLFPSLGTSDLAFVLHEPEAGVLRAARAVEVLVEHALARGASLVRAAARPRGASVQVDERILEADRAIWACGPWLAKLFPALVELRVTRQDVPFFEPPDAAWRTPPVPAWVDYDLGAYGLGDLDGHGVKAVSDAEGPSFDPDEDRREPSPQSAEWARAYLARRFPALADAPLRDVGVCQYELTPDNRFIAAPHPEHPHVWLLGGGSGHGFKHGPALAERVARMLSGDEQPDPSLALGPRGPDRSLRTAGAG